MSDNYIGNEMKTALVCIAKNEDDYIREWVDYNLNIGFDHVFVYANDWKFQSYRQELTVIDFPGQARQLDTYNDFLKKFSPEYDWVFVCDVDEFLNTHGRTVPEVFADYDRFFGVCFNWRLFGDGFRPENDSRRDVTTRFLYCQEKLNRHVKTALNLRKLRQNGLIDVVKFVNPHFVNLNNAITSADRQHYVNGPWNDDLYSVSEFPWLAHYFTKTLGEYRTRRSYGRADTKPESGFFKRSENEFFQHNFNQVKCDELSSLNNSKGL